MPPTWGQGAVFPFPPAHSSPGALSRDQLDARRGCEPGAGVGRLERAQCWPLTSPGPHSECQGGGWGGAVGLCVGGQAGTQSLRASGPEGTLCRHNMELGLAGAAATAGHGPLVPRPEQAAGPRTQRCNPEPRQVSREKYTWGQGDGNSAWSLWAVQPRGRQCQADEAQTVLSVPRGTA